MASYLIQEYELLQKLRDKRATFERSLEEVKAFKEENPMLDKMIGKHEASINAMDTTINQILKKNEVKREEYQTKITSYENKKDDMLKDLQKKKDAMIREFEAKEEALTRDFDLKIANLENKVNVLHKDDTENATIAEYRSLKVKKYDLIASLKEPRGKKEIHADINIAEIDRQIQVQEREIRNIESSLKQLKSEQYYRPTMAQLAEAEQLDRQSRVQNIVETPSTPSCSCTAKWCSHRGYLNPSDEDDDAYPKCHDCDKVVDTHNELFEQHQISPDGFTYLTYCMKCHKKLISDMKSVRDCIDHGCDNEGCYEANENHRMKKRIIRKRSESSE